MSSLRFSRIAPASRKPLCRVGSHPSGYASDLRHTPRATPGPQISLSVSSRKNTRCSPKSRGFPFGVHMDHCYPYNGPFGHKGSPMTYQVALCGIDGMMIACDTREYQAGGGKRL